MSEDTCAHRVDQLFDSRLVDPLRLIGDLTLRLSAHGGRSAIAGRFRRRLSSRNRQQSMLLARDWTGARYELVVGRHSDCDVVIAARWESRRHARLRFRDGTWVLEDLGSTNATTVNGERVGRCFSLGAQGLVID
jgi:hypothetical protein